MPVNPKKKNLENIQFGRIASVLGNRTVVGGVADDGLEPLLDENGRLIVRLAGSGGFLPTPPSYYNTNFSSALAYTNSQILVTGGAASDVIYINGYSDLPVPAFLQIFNAVALPLLGDLPLIVIPLEAGPAAFFKEIVLAALNLTIAISSTRFTYTPIATPCLYVYGRIVL